MNKLPRGFSLIELLMTLTITSVLIMMMFQLFHQNERATRDQTQIMEMQQTARIVASQIADEVRMAGEGVPLYAAAFDAAPSEADTVIFGSSTADRIDFRAGLSNVETAVTSAAPLDFIIGVSRMVSVQDGTGFPTGKFVYIWGAGTDSAWVWLRAQITSAGFGTLTVTPYQTGNAGTIIHFTSAPSISLEEAVSIYLTGNSVRRATATDMTNPASPVWSAANEIGSNFATLAFTYYDASGTVVTPDSLANRNAIARVDIDLTVVVAAALSNGSQPSYSLSMRTIPRNLRLHPAN
jgi:prepilin-type N-terminal cleavage/methylation domain-containing protein